MLKAWEGCTPVWGRWGYGGRMPVPAKDQSILKLGFVLLLGYQVSVTRKTQIFVDP